MAKQEKILAIDIGADSLKVAEFSYPPAGGMILEKFAFTEYGGDLKEEELAGALKAAIITTIKEKGFNSEKVYLSISGQSAFIRFVSLPPIGDKEDRVRQVVEYEAKQNVPFPIEQVVWDYQLIGSAEGDTEINVMFVVIKDSVIEEITNVIEELGKEIMLVDVAPAACYNAARANEIGGEECVMLLNIGSRCASLVFVDSGRFFVRPIAVAGHAITQQISKEFGIPFKDAEELKRKHGFVALGGAYEEPDSEVAATISKIVRNVMTRLHGEINRSINVYRSQQKGNKPNKLYLAGGSSVMAFTPRFFTEKLKIPSDFFNPFQVVSLSPNINREELAEVAHMFSEVIGLGLRHATVCPIEISLVPQKLRKLQEIRHKAPYFLMSAASLVLCLALTFAALINQEKIDKMKSELSTKEVAKTDNMKNEVKIAYGKLETAKADYNFAAKILQERCKVIGIFEEIQRLLPENMWLTSVVPKPTVEGGEVAAAAVAEGGGEGPGGPMMIPIFRKKGGGVARGPTETSKCEWLEVKGYFLYFQESTPLEATFKDNLVKSPLFSSNISEIRMIQFNPGVENNITSFTMGIKLKEPVMK